MKKGVIVLVGILLLIFFYAFKPNRTVETYSGSLEHLLAYSSVVAVYDASGKLIHSKRDTASESVELVNTQLNGEVFYRLVTGEDKGYIKKEVFKYDYRKENFSVSFNNDTASATAPFEATVYLHPIDIKNASISIENEEAYAIAREERVWS